MSFQKENKLETLLFFEEISAYAETANENNISSKFKDYKLYNP